MLVALYGLTFLEFLFPQSDMFAPVSLGDAKNGRMLYSSVLPDAIGVISLNPAPGRWRLFLWPHTGYYDLLVTPICDVCGLLAHFRSSPFRSDRNGPANVTTSRLAVLGPRRYGDLYSLFYELGMLIYLVPPIAGLVFARKREFNVIQKIVAGLIVGFIFYYGFSSGTRNVMVTYVITFVVAYLLVKPGINLKHMVVVARRRLLFDDWNNVNA